MGKNNMCNTGIHTQAKQGAHLGPQTMPKQQQTPLVHFSWQCPGLHGPDSKQDIRPMSFAALLTREQIVIPLFQRPYCWGATSSVHRTSHHDQGKECRLVEGWW